MLGKYTRETRRNCARSSLYGVQLLRNPYNYAYTKVVLLKPVALKCLKLHSDEDIVSHALGKFFRHGFCVGGENANPTLESYNGAGAIV